MSRSWSLREIAAASNKTVGFVSKVARGGIVPRYQPRRHRLGARVPSELAVGLVALLRSGACTSALAETVRTDPKLALEAAEGLAAIARAALDEAPETGQEAA